MLAQAECCAVDLNLIRTAHKQKEQAKEKARKYVVKKGPITAKSLKEAIIEKEVRQSRAKAKKGGKAKGTFLIELNSEIDEIDDIANQKEECEREEEEDENIELAIKPPLTDPFENQHNYISWK